MATAAGTSRLLQRAVERGLLHPANVRQLGPTNLSCAAVGFGAYRVGGGDKEGRHRAALGTAMRAGLNVLDTSSHYSAETSGPSGGHGASEELIGKVLAELGAAAREEVVVCTKLGHVARGAPQPPDAVPVALAQGRGDDWHCIHPDFVAAEVRASRQRLGTPPDFVLLHNPEYFLSAQLQKRAPIADAWDEMYERLQQAFVTLEALCEEGEIGHGYGVSGNFLSCFFSTTGRSNVYEALALDRVADAARAAAGGQASRFKLAQLPLNAFESGAVLGRGAVVPEAAEGDCDLAGRLGLGLVTNRPLNALPMPGVSTGDWGRGGASYLSLRDAKPMGAVESLLRRVLAEVIPHEGTSAPSLQQLALRLALSAPSVSTTLCGLRSESYVEDATAVLSQPPLSHQQVRQAMLAVRSAAEELGCQNRGFW